MLYKCFIVVLIIIDILSISYLMKFRHSRINEEQLS